MSPGFLICKSEQAMMMKSVAKCTQMMNKIHILLGFFKRQVEKEG
jgi:hypothetical protein